MHELPVVREMIRLVNAEAEKKKLRRVKSITIVVGELSSVVDESVQMYFELLAQGTPCDGAKLRFEHQSAMLKCTRCGNEFEHHKKFDCPRCGGPGVLIRGSGQELYIRSIDAE